MDIKQYMEQVGLQARSASRAMVRADTTRKNRALERIADLLVQSMDLLLSENQKDLDAGKKSGLDAALLDRLALDQARVEGMAQGLRQIAALPDRKSVV